MLSIILKSLLQDKKATSQELMDLLCISKDTFYKRLNGQSEFLLSEAVKLSQKYNFSLDSIFDTEKTHKQFVIKKFPILETPLATVEHYVNELYKDLQQVQQSGLQQIYYAAKDLPLFTFFASPILTSFKLHFWYIALFDADSHAPIFRADWLPKNVLQKSKQLFDLYNSCDSVEIWNFETINSTLHQIEYCVSAGWLKKEDATNIINEMHQMLEQTKLNCEQQSKEKKGKLAMYCNEILLLDNSVIFDLGQIKIFYLPYQTLNFLRSTDEEFTTLNLEWFDKQIKKSALLTGASQKDRERLFNSYFQKLLDCTIG